VDLRALLYTHLALLSKSLLALTLALAMDMPVLSVTTVIDVVTLKLFDGY